MGQSRSDLREVSEINATDRQSNATKVTTILAFPTLDVLFLRSYRNYCQFFPF